MRRVGGLLAAFASGMIAFSLIGDKGRDHGTLQPPPAASDHDSQDFSSDEYTSDSYEFPASENALKEVSRLNHAFLQEGSSASPEQIARVKEMVDAYVKANPPREGKTVTTEQDGNTTAIFSEPSYDPLYDLWGAVTQQEDVDPLFLGLLMKELGTRIKAETAKDRPLD